jgi:3-mercaptopyruvate sulfurtransferase SseA
MKYFLSLAILSSLLFAKSLMAQEGIKGNLVTADWLEKNLKNVDVIILDASTSQIYKEKHIPGAISYDIFTYGVQEMPVAEIEKRYQSWGISPGKKIVMYDQGGSMMATRLFFSLNYYGFPVKNLFILDGGLSKWQETGLTITNEQTPTPKKGSFTITKLNEDTRVDLPEFLNASGDQINNVLIDALDANWHFGGLNIFGRPGHIPNAIMIPVDDFYNQDKTFKSAEEIKKILAYFRIKLEQQVYSHCGGGIAASVPFFAIKFLLGYPKVKLYPGSQLEWASDQRELPFWTYATPSLMRETGWLQGWGGRMMRMYGISQISIVDVRTEDAFNKGHLPFALNISADVFKKNISNPEKLSELLGPIGVNASHEAVIISGAGLTKESALAFVMLEKLGQKKVSVFIDSLGKSVRLGLALTNDTTAVGPKKSPMDLSILPTTYPKNFLKDVIISDAKNTEGVYPKIFIASGKNVPAKVLDSKVVHVPYTDLLDADGTPKAAKDIWNVLTKAGVPRYAELVCYSEDPGEAAVNYFILKLMGYPDIKVLVN